MNLVWVTFEILNKLICDFLVGNHKIRMNDIYFLFVCNRNKELIDQFIQNLKINPNKVHDLKGEMKKSLKKKRLETNILPQIHKISRITDSYGITTYLGRTFKNNEVALEQCWIREKFEFSEPDLYKQVPTVTCDETRHKTYIVPVGRCALHTSRDEPNVEKLWRD